MPALTSVAVCVFDAYGTLYDFNAAAARCRDALGDKAEPLSALWRQKQLQYTWLRSLMGRYASFWQVTGEALDHALAQLGIADNGLRQRLMDCYHGLDAFPEVPGVLKRLKDAGIRLAILSNGSPGMLAGAAERTGLDKLLEISLSVDAVKVFKPDHRVYRLVTDHFAVPAGRVAFFSSNAWDAHAGADFGFQSVWLNRTRAAAENLPGRLAATRESLADLPALLELA
jgi:2-haloacid dehalogenase